MIRRRWLDVMGRIKAEVNRSLSLKPEFALQTTAMSYRAGDRVIFFAYSDPAMREEDRIFSHGQYGVVSAVNEDGGLQVFPTDEEGKMTSLEGDTLFPEEVIRLSYAPRLDVAQLMEDH